MAAQVAHISDAWLRKAASGEDGYEYKVEEIEWCKDPYLSVLAVDNPEELEEVMADALNVGLDVHMWKDLIPSENLNRNMSNVLIGCSIGPADFDKIKAITGNLPLA
jgi:peptidyl-tRNA hydrolase